MNEFEIIHEVANIFAAKFAFGVHSHEDIYQQCWVYSLEALPKYDKKRPLKPFLFSVLYTRLINFKRNNYARTEKPCSSCPFFSSSCTIFEPPSDCPIYSSWEHRNRAKRSLSSATEIPPIAARPLWDPLDYPPDLLPLIERAISGEKLSKGEKEHLINEEARWNPLADQ